VTEMAVNIKLELMYGLHYVLGYAKTLLTTVNLRAEQKADLVRGAFAMFIYCDLVDGTMVGDVEAALLRTVPLNRKKERGVIVNHLFNPGLYMRVNKNLFNVIEVDIRTDSGEEFPFAKDSKMLLTLHFQRDNNDMSTDALLPPLTYLDDRKIYIQ